MMSRSKAATIVLSVLFLAMSLLPSFAKAEYAPFFKPLRDKKGGLWIAIRKLTGEGPARYLAIDPNSFASVMMDEKDAASDALEADWKETPYARALERYSAKATGLQAGGLRHGARGGLFLTIDLCPSHKKMDTELFNSALEMAAKSGTPLPVAIAVSGMWMEKHEDELEFILDMEKKGGLSITWINHTYSHPYEKDRPLEENFLLAPGVDFEKEVLSEEEALIRRGLIPSPFFRFPGLVADGNLLERLKRLFLIPVGADAWMAKGERPKEGSIILVHGNGNEPEGVRKLVDFYRAKEKALGGELKFLPLKDALFEETGPPSVIPAP